MNNNSELAGAVPGHKKVTRRKSFLARLDMGVTRKLSRKSSFLDSKPIRTIAKLTRR